jgi:Leucine-rich repeat (LRR) protein
MRSNIKISALTAVIAFVAVLLSGCGIGTRNFSSTGNNDSRNNPATTSVGEIPPKTNIDNMAPPIKSTELDLTATGLTGIPASVLSMTKLKKLNLSNNAIKTLPSEMGNLINLEELNISNNELTGAMVAEVRKMTKLKILNLSDNKMTGIPAEIGQLKYLTTLNISRNQINTYPNEIANLKDSLKTLDLTGNKFSSEKIQEIKNLLPNTEVKF